MTRLTRTLAPALLVMVLLVLLAGAAQAAAVTRYCSPSGTDAAYPARGTEALPYKNISYALTDMEAAVEASGETGFIVLENGVYSNQAKYVGQFPERATATQIIEIAARNAGMATLGTSDTYGFGWDSRSTRLLNVRNCKLGGVYGVAWLNCSDCEFTGLEKSVVSAPAGGKAFMITNGENITITDSLVRNGVGFSSCPNVTHLTVERCQARCVDSPLVSLKVVGGVATNYEKPWFTHNYSGLGTEGYILIGTQDPNIRWWAGNGLNYNDNYPQMVPNANAATAIWESWNGTAWVAATVTDGTAVDGKTFAKPGYIQATYTAAHWAEASNVDVLGGATLPVDVYPLPLYWHRLRFTADLSAGTAAWIRNISSDGYSNHNLDGFLSSAPDATYRDCISIGAGQAGFDVQGTRLLLERCTGIKNGTTNFKCFNVVAHPDVYPEYPGNPNGVRYSDSWDDYVRLINCLAWGTLMDTILTGTIEPYTELINCTFIGNQQGFAVSIQKRAIHTTPEQYNQVIFRNCLFDSRRGNLMYQCDAVQTPVFENCLLVERGADTLNWARLGSGSSAPMETVAQAKANTTKYLRCVWTADPLYGTEAVLDFRHGTASAAVDIGETCTYLPEKDAFDNDRFQGEAPDAGFYESPGTAPENRAPIAPTLVAVTPASPTATEDLEALATGQSDPDGDDLTIEYSWCKSVDDGVNFDTWGGTDRETDTLSNTFTAAREVWKCRARAYDAEPLYSGYTESVEVTIDNTVPTVPTLVQVTPGSPETADNLTATASGATDADGDPVTYEYQWAESANGSAWGGWFTSPTLETYEGPLTPAYYYKSRGRATDSYDVSAWVESAAVQVAEPTVVVVVVARIGKPINNWRFIIVHLTNVETGEILSVVYTRQNMRTDKAGTAATVALLAKIEAARANLGAATTVYVDKAALEAALNAE
jgi:hypothetical protein